MGEMLKMSWVDQRALEMADYLVYSVAVLWVMLYTVKTVPS